MTVIETARCRLRPLRADDDAAVRAMFLDPEVMRHYPMVRSATAAMTWQASLRGFQARYGFAPWTLELRDGTFAGQCGPLPQLIDGRLEVEIICFLLRPFWRAAYSDEASLAGLRFAFERLSARRIIGLIMPGNRPSIRLARRCGLRFDRRVEHDGFPMELFALDRHDWLQAATCGRPNPFSTSLDFSALAPDRAGGGAASEPLSRRSHAPMAKETYVGSIIGGSSDSGLLAQEQAQFDANFALQTTQAMADNKNATNTAIANSHAQTAASATASAREVGQAEAHILA